MNLTSCTSRWVLAAFAPLLCTVAGAQEAARTFGLDCEPAQTASVARLSVEIDGTSPVSRDYPVKANTRLLILVRERGVDLRMELADPARGARLSVDSPLRRWGPQRAFVEPGQARVIKMTMLGKERVRGTAEVQIFLAGGMDKDCLAIHRLLARGDEHHSRGLRISARELPSQPGAVRREHEAAIRSYQEASKRLSTKKAGAPRAQAAMSVAAALYQGVQAYSQALAAAQRAEFEFQAIGDAYGVDRARAMRAASQIELAPDTSSLPGSAGEKQRRTAGLFEAARAVLAQIAESHASRGEFYDQALAQNNIGLALFREQKYDLAIEAYQRALAIHQRLGERARQGQALQNIALTNYDIGHYEEARLSYQRVLTLIDKTESPKLYADVLNNLALSEQKSGRPDAALQHYSQSLEMHLRLQNVGEQARSLHGIGSTYFDIGNLSEASSYFERALEIRKSVIDPYGRLASLRGLADIARNSGDVQSAIARREEALSLAPTPGTRILVLVDLVRDALQGGYRDKASRYLEEIFVSDAGGDSVLYARALLERARFHLMENSLDQAAKDAQQARQLFRGQQLASAIFSSLILEARIACARGELAAAESKADEAMKLAESLRRSSSNPTLRATMWPALRPAFDLRIDLLAQPRPCGVPRQTPSFAAALEVAERARSRALEDFREMAEKGDAAALPEEKKRAKAYEKLADRRARIEALSEAARSNEAVLTGLRDEVAQLAREIDMLDAEIGAKRTPGKRAKRSAALITEMIPAGVAVVEYWLGEKNSYAWLVTRDHIRMFELGPSARIDKTSRDFHDSLRGFANIDEAERIRRSQELSALILAPLESQLRRAKRIYFVPDGSLHTVPFAALQMRDGEARSMLVEKFDVAVASTIRTLGGAPVTGSVRDKVQALIVADPVYARDDSRLNSEARLATAPADHESFILRGRRGGGRAWQSLPASRREADAILALLPSAQVRVLSGFDANRETLLEQDLSRFRILHFATHAVADVEAPHLSALILSTWSPDGQPVSGEVFAGDILLRRLDADLVVLSACDTAMGRRSAGEGLLGLRYAAHAGGARGVVATLWPVVDTVGATVMADMYAAIIKDKKDSVAALSQAMRVARAKWKDPALWAVYQASTASVRTTLH